MNGRVGQDGLQQRGAGDGVRVVAKVALAGGVDLFAVEPEWLASAQSSWAAAVRPGQGLHEPGEHGKNGPCVPARPALPGVTVDERAGGAEAAGDGVDRAPDARSVGGFEAEQREHEDGDVEVRSTGSVGSCAEPPM